MIGTEDPYLYRNNEVCSEFEHELNKKFIEYRKSNYKGSENDKIFLKHSLRDALQIPKGRIYYVEKMIGMIKFAFHDEATDIITDVWFQRSTRTNKDKIKKYISNIPTGQPEDFVTNFKKLNNKLNCLNLFISV